MTEMVEVPGSSSSGPAAAHQSVTPEYNQDLYQVRPVTSLTMQIEAGPKVDQNHADN